MWTGILQNLARNLTGEGRRDTASDERKCGEQESKHLHTIITRAESSPVRVIFGGIDGGKCGEQELTT